MRLAGRTKSSVTRTPTTRGAMSEFLTPLRVEKLHARSPQGRALWQTLAPLVYHSDRLGRVLTVPTGFVTDFATVPRFLPISWWLAGDTAHAAATVHDYLYTYRATEHVTKKDADRVFYEAMCLNGEPTWRRWLMWGAVSLFGGRRNAW